MLRRTPRRAYLRHDSTDTRIVKATEAVYRAVYVVTWQAPTGRVIGRKLITYDQAGDYGCGDNCDLVQTLQGDDDSYAIEFSL